MNMTPEFEKYFEAQGWIMECESPLEIRHEDGSFATYQAAKSVIREIQAQYNEENGIRPESTLDDLTSHIEEIIKINELVQGYVEKAREQKLLDEEESKKGYYSDEAEKMWDTNFSLVFSDHISHRVRFLLDEMNMSMDYYDPDTSYEEDVCAYADALNQKAKTLIGLAKKNNNIKNRKTF